MLAQVGAVASSKSAMNACAPELSALITILRSVGPVISTRRSIRSAGIGATVQSPARMLGGLGQEIGQRAGVERLLPLGPRGEQRLAAAVETAVEPGDEGERLGGQDRLASATYRAL